MLLLLLAATLTAPAFGVQPAQTTAPEAVAPERARLRELDAPLPVRFRLQDGATITGMLTMWSADGLVGSFGFRAWHSLQPIEAWRLFRRVMDHESRDDWISLGRALMLTESGAAMADAAFLAARALDPEAGDRIAAARTDAARVIAARQADVDGGIAAERLRLDPPHWRQWPAIPWPALDTQANAAEDSRIRDDVATMLALVGVSLAPVRTDSLLLYSSDDRTTAARIAVRLEALRVRLADRLGVPPTDLAAAGRIAVVILDDRRDFRAVQQRIFLQLDRPQVRASCHSLGQRSIVVAHRGPDGPELEFALAQQLVHAFMHRYLSPRRLPPWANEGLALSIAAQLVPEVHDPRVRRRRALTQLRAGSDPTPLIAAEYTDASWPGPEEMGPTIGRMLVELLIADQPMSFSAWVADVKSGESWSDALGARFGMAPARIIQAFVRHHRVRD